MYITHPSTCLRCVWEQGRGQADGGPRHQAAQGQDTFHQVDVFKVVFCSGRIHFKGCKRRGKIKIKLYSLLQVREAAKKSSSLYGRARDSVAILTKGSRDSLDLPKERVYS